MIIFLCVVLYIPDAGVHAGDICSWAIVCMVLRRIRLEQMTAFFFVPPAVFYNVLFNSDSTFLSSSLSTMLYLGGHHPDITLLCYKTRPLHCRFESTVDLWLASFREIAGEVQPFFFLCFVSVLG